MQWYYAVGGEQKGPVPESELKDLVESGSLSVDALVWNEAMTEWRPVSEVKPEWTAAPPIAAPGAAGSPPRLPPGQVSCSQCGRVFPEEELVRIAGNRVCAACKAIALQSVREGVPTSSRSAELEQVLAVAKAQKGVLWCILASVINTACFFAVGLSVSRISSGPPVPYFFLPMLSGLMILVFQVLYAYRLASNLDRGLAWLWIAGLVLGFFVCGLLGLILLLVLSSRATRLIRKSGFHVGIMGANLGEIRAALGGGPARA